MKQKPKKWAMIRVKDEVKKRIRRIGKLRGWSNGDVVEKLEQAVCLTR